MTSASSLEAALRAGADGLYALEAGVGLLIAHGSWLDRQDFKLAASITNPGTDLAVIDWEAAIAALNAGDCPGSSGEEKILRLAADIPVPLEEAVIGLDDDNVALLVQAVLHASGHRQLPR